MLTQKNGSNFSINQRTRDPPKFPWTHYQIDPPRTQIPPAKWTHDSPILRPVQVYIWPCLLDHRFLRFILLSPSQSSGTIGNQSEALTIQTTQQHHAGSHHHRLGHSRCAIPNVPRQDRLRCHERSRRLLRRILHPQDGF
jgi:hypothetical protein